MSSRAKARSFPCFLREDLSGKVVLASGVERCSSGEIKRYVRFISRCVCVLHNMLSPCKIWLTSSPFRQTITMQSGTLYFPMCGQGHFSLTNQTTETCVPHHEFLGYSRVYVV